MWVYILLSVFIVIITVIFVVIVVNINKFQALNIKINEAEENIGLLLNEKYDLLYKIGKIVKDESSDTFFDNLKDIVIEDISKIELNKELSKYDAKIVELTDYNKDIKFDEDALKLFSDLEDVNIECAADEKYYNDNVEIYNKLVSQFPSSIIAKFKKCKHKDSYVNEKEEIFEIMKE